MNIEKHNWFFSLFSREQLALFAILELFPLLFAFGCTIYSLSGPDDLFEDSKLVSWSLFLLASIINFLFCVWVGDYIETHPIFTLSLN